MSKMLTLKDNVVRIGSKYFIMMPNGEILTDNRFSLRENAKQDIARINEAIRRKGGRPRKTDD